MASLSTTPAVWVQVAQALVAREMVEVLGVPGRRAAELLGVAPSAVSQYLAGKRLHRRLQGLVQSGPAREIANRAAHRLVELGPGGAGVHRVLLETASDLAERVVGVKTAGAPADGGDTGAAAVDRELARQLRRRITAEQATVAECMQLAQRARDELTRAIFRQIASDSLRHAEIVASLAQYLDRGLARSLSSGITRQDVERLIEREREAEDHRAMGLSRSVGGVMAVLAGSMEADERKHEEILQGLLAAGFPDSGSKRGRHRPRRRRPVAR